MEKDILRRVQLKQLTILKEVRRVCEENDIAYFLDSGTLIGAVRHEGFIPWDDDVDVGMLRKDYIKFCELAPSCLGEEYVLQTWENDDMYANPFAKVRMKNTRYIEATGTTGSEKGFYIDIFPFDFAFDDSEKQKKMMNDTMKIRRMILMKCGVKPWIKNGRVNIIKRIGYIYYQIIAAFRSHAELVKKYESIVTHVKESEYVYEQVGYSNTMIFELEWFKNLVDMKFEDDYFSAPAGTHGRLQVEYGDYMQLPPENERENRHQIIEIDFGEE